MLRKALWRPLSQLLEPVPIDERRVLKHVRAIVGLFAAGVAPFGSLAEATPECFFFEEWHEPLFGGRPFFGLTDAGALIEPWAFAEAKAVLFGESLYRKRFAII